MNSATRRRSRSDFSPGNGGADRPWHPAVLLPLVISFAALAFGAVHEWASAAAELVLWALTAAWCLRATGQRLPPDLVAAAGALLLYLGLQILPLPSALVWTLDPAAARVRGESLATLGGTKSGAREGEAIAGAEDERIPRQALERIRVLAGESSRGASSNWFPLSLDPYTTRSDLLVYLACGAVFALSATATNPAGLLLSVVGLGAAMALLGLVELATWNGRILWFFVPYDVAAPLLGVGRMFASFVNPDHFASFLILCLPAGVGLFASPELRSRLGPVAKTLVLLGLAVMVAALIGAASRAAILAVLLGLAVFGAQGVRSLARAPDPRSRSSRRPPNRLERARSIARRVAPLAVGAAIVVGGAIYAGSAARAVLGQRIAVSLLNSEELGFRLEMARQSLPMLADFPLVGVGAGCWRHAYRRYESYPIVGHRPNHAHDDYVEWAIEVGAIGVALTLLLAWRLARSARANESIPDSARAGILAALVAIGGQEVVDFGLRAPANAWLLAALLGLLVNRAWSSRRVGREAPAAVGRSAPAWLAALAILAWLSIVQLREFLQWSSVRAGSAELAFAPRSADTWFELGALLDESGYRERPPTAVCLRAAIERRPTSAAAFALLGLGAGTAADQRRLLEAALDLDPTHAAWRLEYARLLERAGDRVGALGAVEEAAYRDPRPESHPYLDPSNARLRSELLDAVERGFHRALVERPEDSTLLSGIALFHYRFKRWADAAELWERASTVGADRSLFALRAGDAFALAGQYDRAENLVERALDADPSNTEAYRVLAMSIDRPQHRYEHAAKLLEIGAHRSSDPATLYLARYLLETEKGDRQAAIEALAKAADLRQRDAALAYQLGAAYFEAEDFHRAEIALDRAIAIDPANAASHFLRGVAAERRYDLSKAAKSYDEATALDPKNATYAENAERLRRDLKAQ